MIRNDARHDQGAPPPPSAPSPSTPFVPAEIAGITPPLVGRDAELQQLIGELYAVIEGGQLRLVTVVGPAGIGKSRLAHEFRQVVGRLPEPVTLLGLQADPQSTGRPFSLYRQLIATLCRVREGDRPEQACAQIEQALDALLLPDAEAKAHFIGQLAGYDLADSPHLRGLLAEPRQIRDRAAHYTIQYLQALTAQAPLVLLLDDAHHTDDGSLDLFAQIVGDGRELGLLVVGLAQQRLYERRPTWDEAADDRGARLNLAPLDERGGRRLVAEILRKAGKLPSDLRNLVVSRAEGNPFYIEELIKMLIADGVIVPGSAAWTVQQGRLSRLRIPATLGELLWARVQALTPAARDLLLRAAVVGRVFWVEAALAVAGTEPIAEHSGPAPSAAPPPDTALAALLAAMEAAELIAPAAESRFVGQREYAFRHELLHEVAYGHVPPEQRARYHQRAAAWLVARGDERADAYAGLIAEHYERGGSPRQAAHWYVVAGHDARKTYAAETAIRRYQAALALLPAGPASRAEQIACFEGMGEAQLALARLADAATSYRQLAEVATAAADQAAAARGWNGLAFVQDHALEYQASAESARNGIAHAAAAGAATELALGHFHLAWAELRLDNLPEALALGRQARTIVAAADDPATLARVDGLLGQIYDLLGNADEAIHFQQQALAYNRATGNLSEVATQLNNLGCTLNAMGDFAGALCYLEEAQAISHATGARMIEIFVLSNLGATWNGLGDYAAAEAAARHGIELSELSRMPVFADFAYALAEACLRQGRVTEAVEAAQQSLDLARAHEGPREVAAAWRALGRTIGAMSDSQGAPRCFAESARIFGEADARAELARTLRAWAEHELRRGDKARGRELWGQARAHFAAVGLAHELARTPAEPPVEP